MPQPPEKSTQGGFEPKPPSRLNKEPHGLSPNQVLLYERIDEALREPCMSSDDEQLSGITGCGRPLLGA